MNNNVYDYQQEFFKRAKRLEAIKNREVLEAHLVFYKENPVNFIEDWFLTYDPRLKDPFIPFILFEKQKEYIYWLKDKLERKQDGLVEKSRDIGATWLCVAFSVWAFCFIDGIKIAFGSRKEKLVDCVGDPDCIFEKARMILIKLPLEFKPKYTAPFMKIMNHDNGAIITGESGDNIGRGGRSTIYFKDESAFYERPEKIEAALSQNSDVKIDVSTPNGTGNPFYKKRFSGKYPVFVFDWRDDPRKDNAWYERQKDLLEPWILAQEVDRDYNASVEGICIPAKYVKSAINFDINPEGIKIAGLDVADEGGDFNALVIMHGSKCIYINKWKHGSTTDTARKAHSILKDFNIDELKFDSIGVGAGVKGEMKSINEKEPVKYRVVGFNAGSTKLDGIYGLGKMNKDMFANMKAKVWWNLRKRFEKTYEVVNKIKEWPVDECISIPNNNELITELSQPKVEYNDAGKIIIESKKKMKARGVNSPNLADALVMATEKPTIVFVG